MIHDTCLRVSSGSLRNLKCPLRKGSRCFISTCFANETSIITKFDYDKDIKVLTYNKSFALDTNNFPRLQQRLCTLSCRQSNPIHVRAFSTNINDVNRDSWEQYTPNSNNNQKLSNRALFKAIPVNPSILEYIKSVGVGIRSQNKKKKKKRTLKQRNADSGILNEADENEYFIEKNGTRRTRKPSKMIEEREGIVRSGVTPPPPFSSQLPAGAKDVNDTGHQIKRLPVKVLGSVGSSEEEMPKSSRGLAEVAIVGRSNVGKSTLLNALLYGNQFDDELLENRKFVRGKTPIGAKIGKGVKAAVSNTPGETKRITFYQLSSYVLDSASTTNRKKVSLVLVDLPGYGFAFANEEKASSWKELMKEFILNRGSSLKRILMLIDARHGFKRTDFEFLEMLQDGLVNATKDSTVKKKLELPPIQVVLTKCDLVSQDDLARRVVLSREQLSYTLKREPSALPVMLVSARAGLGFNNIRGNHAKGGILELQKELAALVPK